MEANLQNLYTINYIYRSINIYPAVSNNLPTVFENFYSDNFLSQKPEQA